MDTEDQGLSSVPAHVNMVKDGLLDFNHFLGLEATMLVLSDEKSDGDDGDDIPLFAYKTDGLKVSERAREREFLENAKELAEGAQRLESGLVGDGGKWRTLFRNAVTSRMDDVRNCGSHQLSTIACAENVLWDTDLDPFRHSYTNPKPDLYFGFPVYNTKYHKLAGFRNDSAVRNFSVDTLFQLAATGLRCMPVSSSLNGEGKMKRDSTEVQAPLLCFPWCIIQLKGIEKAVGIKENDDSTSESSCEASTAATGALAMIENLARFADVKQDGQHIPPVITITSVGPNTTVWLAYSDIVDAQYRDHKMVSIWDGCISKIWDAIQFCRIVDNLFFWSQYILRPKVLHYIDQWRFRNCAEIHNLHSRLEKDLEAAELVHRIQDRLSLLSITPSSDLSKLVQQAVIFLEVMKSNLREAEPAPKEGPDPNAQAEVGISKKAPSHPTVYASAVGAPVDGMTAEREQERFESKEGKGETKDDDLDGDRGGCDMYYSAGLRADTTHRPKPSENAAVLIDLPANNGKSTDGDSAATENKLSQRSTNTKFPTATNSKFSVAPSKKAPIREQGLKYNSLTGLSNDEKRHRESSFSYPYQFKTSDFEFDQRRFLSHSLKSKSICSREPNVSKDLASKKNSNSRSRSADASSGLLNPFIAKSFKLSFPVKHWWYETPIAAQRVMRKSGPHAAPHKQITFSSGEYEASDLEHTVWSEPPKRRKPEWQLSEIPKPRLPGLKIPWKDGRCIIVRLPPVVPVPPPQNRPDPFIRKYPEY